MVEYMVETYDFPVVVTTYPSFTGSYGKNVSTFYGGGYSDYEAEIFDYFEGDTHVHVKRNKKQKVGAKDYAEQKQMAEIGIKEGLLANKAYTPYEFYMENKNLLPNISYAIITQIFTRLQHELFK